MTARIVAGLIPPGRKAGRMVGRQCANIQKDLCIRLYRPPNVPPGACVGQRLPAPRQALKTFQPVAAYGLYGKIIANVEYSEKRPPRQAAARHSAGRDRLATDAPLCRGLSPVLASGKPDLCALEAALSGGAP